mgnify:CR=1 FL=1
MSTNPEGITNPPIDDLLEKVDSKYRLVIFAAKRARQINAYYSQLGEGLLENVGPLVSVAALAQNVPPAPVRDTATPDEKLPDSAERAAAEADPAFTFVDPFAELDANSPS